MTLKKAYYIGIGTAKYIWCGEYQIIVTTHLNIDNIRIIGSTRCYCFERLPAQRYYLLGNHPDPLCFRPSHGLDPRSCNGDLHLPCRRADAGKMDRIKVKYGLVEQWESAKCHSLQLKATVQPFRQNRCFFALIGIHFGKHNFLVLSGKTSAV